PAKEYDKVYVKMNLAHLQRLLDTEKIEYLVLLLDETENLSIVASQLSTVISGEYEYREWTQLAEFYQGVVNLYTSIFRLSFIVLSIIVILSITNTMSMSVFERFREIGTLRAMGQTRLSIIGLFVSEGIIIGILGGIIGVLAGTGFAQLINLSGGIAIPAPPGMSSGYTARINIDFTVILYSFMMSMITATVSSLYPAIIAARKDIVEALTHI
ncbi:ABC transporter permease, partial [Escherichia coli]|nr:ABC transporter permease [Escherichia coli]